MKKLLAVILTAALLIGSTALAASVTAPVPAQLTWVETVTYYGSGVFKIELMKNIAWRSDYTITAQDAAGVAQTVSVLGGDANDVYVQLTGSVVDDALYTFSFVSAVDVMEAQGVATRGASYSNYCEYCLVFGHDDDVCVDRISAGIVGEVDRCDICGELGHDDDDCPNRVVGVVYCDECGQTGHDDDDCPYDDDDDDWDEWCGRCGKLGHDDDDCPNGRCDECGQLGHDDDHCPNERCDECGQLGHDDDDCPNERCDECGQLGHDDDHCPNERCDECGKLGHDDDHCPNRKHGGRHH